MTWYHPNYYKRLKANRQQASGNGRVGPQVSSAKKNKSLDRSRNMGYCGTTAEVKYSETAIRSGPAGPLNAQQDASTAPLMGPLQCAAADALQEVQHKHPGMGTVRNCSAMVKSKPRVLSSQADKQQARGNGRVGPKGTSCQASGDSRINKR